MNQVFSIFTNLVNELTHDPIHKPVYKREEKKIISNESLVCGKLNDGKTITKKN